MAEEQQQKGCDVTRQRTDGTETPMMKALYHFSCFCVFATHLLQCFTPVLFLIDLKEEKTQSGGEFRQKDPAADVKQELSESKLFKQTQQLSIPYQTCLCERLK